MSPPKFSPFVAGAFALNYIIGSGFLLLPWVFIKAGVGLSILVLALVAGLSILSIAFIVDTDYRADVLLKHGYRQNKSFIIDETSRLLRIDSVSYTTMEERSNPSDEVATSSDDEEYSANEITDLCYLYLGNIGKNLYMVFLILFIYGALWAYACVYAHTMSTVFTLTFLGMSAYNSQLALFSVVALPLSLIELTEQVNIQLLLTFCRFLMLFLMLSTLGYSLLYHKKVFANYDLPGSHTTTTSVNGSIQTVEEAVPRFNFSNIYIILPIAGMYLHAYIIDVCMYLGVYVYFMYVRHTMRL